MTEKGKGRSPIKVLVLDVLKPHKPNIVDFGKTLCDAPYVECADITVYAVDEKTESLKMNIEGSDIEFDDLKALIEEQGGAVHSIDKVIVGRKPRYESHLVKHRSEHANI